MQSIRESCNYPARLLSASTAGRRQSQLQDGQYTDEVSDVTRNKT